MANNVVGSLLVNLGLETGRLKSDTEKAKRHFKDFDRKANQSLGRIKRGVAGLRASMAGLNGMLGVLSVGGIGLLIRGSINSADEIQKLNLRLGASTEALSEYRHVMDISGVSFNAFTKGLQNMVDKVSDAAMGTGEAALALKQLGINAQQLNQLAPEDQFEIIAEALSKVTVAGDKTRIAMDLFGGRGVSLLQSMQNGAKGIRELRDEAKGLGLSLSVDQVNAAADANDAMVRLKGAFSGLAMQVALGVAGPLEDFANMLSEGIPASVKIANKVIDEFWLFVNPSKASALGQMSALGLEIQQITDGIKSLVKQKEEMQLNGPLAEHVDKLIENDRKRIEALMVSYEALDATRNRPGLKIEARPSAEAGVPDDSAEKQKLQVKLDALTLSLMTEEERLQESLNRRQDIVADSFNRGLVDEESRKALMLELEKDFEMARTKILKDNMSDRQKFAAKSAWGQTKDVVGAAVELTQGVAGQNKKMFQINKIAGIANAVIGTYEGASKTMGAYPYPLNIALAGLSIAAGLAQVRAIQSTSFGGGGGAAPSLAATGGTPGNPVIQDTGSFAPTNTAVDTSRQITINIEGNVFANDDFRRALVDALEQAQLNDEVVIRNAI